MQTSIVIIIVAIAAVYIFRRFYRSMKATAEAPTCGCGCDGCSEVNTCEDPSASTEQS